MRHPCDMATRVSARGALTWWHLDDGGEFVMQDGLPLGPRSLQAPTLYGPNGKPIVKLFIFAERRIAIEKVEPLETGITPVSLSLPSYLVVERGGSSQTLRHRHRDTHRRNRFGAKPLLS